MRKFIIKLHGELCPSIKPSGDKSLVKLVKHNFGPSQCTVVFQFRAISFVQKRN